MTQDQWGAVVRKPWSLEGYREHNNDLAKKYGEPVEPIVVRALEKARQHLRNAEQRLGIESRVSELHFAVASLLRAVEQMRGKGALP